MEHTEQEIEAIVAMLRRRGGDSTNIEAKAAEGGTPKLGETFCAFSNMPDGGLVICGLDEKTGFRAVDIPNMAQLEASVVSQARNAVEPPAHVEVSTVAFEGKELLLIDVAPLPLSARPSLYRGKAYLRQSDGDYPMSAAELAQLETMKARHRPDADATPVPGTSSDDLDPALTRDFIAAVRRASPRLAEAPDAEILRKRRVLARNGELTLAGLYALGAYPQEYCPWLRASAVETGSVATNAVDFGGDAGSVAPPSRAPSGSPAASRPSETFVPSEPSGRPGCSTTGGAHTPGSLALARHRDFDGPLPVMLDDAMAWLAARLARPRERADAATPAPGFPLAAVREIVANALVHRLLDDSAGFQSVEIRLSPASLVVTSPGGLWGVESTRLGTRGSASPVNPTLYDICKLARTPSHAAVIAGDGGGLAETIRAFRDAGLLAPTFVDTGLSMQVMAERPRP